MPGQIKMSDEKLSAEFIRKERNIGMSKILYLILIPGICLSSLAQAVNMQINPEAKSFKYSRTIEKERPKLAAETQRLIAAYRQNPSSENLNALRKQIEKNYDKVVARKKAKLEELKKTARERSKIAEMETIVNEMLLDRENRINQTLSRFTDTRLTPGARNTKDGFLPVLGAARNVYIAYAPVTNEEYVLFLKETGKKAPRNWKSGMMPREKEKYPVVSVSYADAEAYCRWLSEKDGNAAYRLPTEKEWELAAGHMPKDADFNSGERKGLTPVSAYAQTLSASGAVDMWGNVWEWTSTQKVLPSGEKGLAVKGGAWNSPRTGCRTENRNEIRNPSIGYDNVGFRIIRETRQKTAF